MFFEIIKKFIIPYYVFFIFTNFPLKSFNSSILPFKLMTTFIKF